MYNILIMHKQTIKTIKTTSKKGKKITYFAFYGTWKFWQATSDEQYTKCTWRKRNSLWKMNWLHQDSITSGMEIVEPPIEETELPYFVGIACVAENGEYEGSDSRPAWTLAANKVLGNEFVKACSNKIAKWVPRRRKFWWKLKCSSFDSLVLHWPTAPSSHGKSRHYRFYLSRVCKTENNSWKSIDTLGKIVNYHLY